MSSTKRGYIRRDTTNGRSLTRALVAQNAPSYRAARWFFRDFVIRYRWRLATVSLIGFAAAGLQGAALAALNTMIGASADEPIIIPILNQPLTPNQAAPAVGFLAILALGVSAVLTYIQGREVLALWQRYHVHTVNALIEAVRRAVGRGAADEATIRQAPIVAALRQTQRLGASTRLVAGSIIPILRFVVFAGLAVVLNPGLTIVLLLVAVPSGGLTLLFFARGGSRSARRVANLSRNAAQDLNARLAAALQQQSVAFEAGLPQETSPFIERGRALTGRILVVEQARLVTAIMAVVATMLFLLYGAYQGSLEPANWSQHLVYLIALLLAFTQLVAAASAVSGFGRFYPAVVLHKNVLELLDDATSPAHLRQLLVIRGLKSDAPSDDDVLD